MIICHCKGKTDREIAQAVQHGARSSAEVMRACSAGSDCGGCLNAIRSYLRRGQGSTDASTRTPRSA